MSDDYDAFDDDEKYYASLKWWEKIQRKYWKIIPHRFRPGELWYQLKCFVWYRYTTVKPQYLGHSWCDRTELLPHMMFQILSDFIIKENGGIDFNKSIVDWEYDEIHRNAKNDMIKLYKWWHEQYIPFFKDGWKLIPDNMQGDFTSYRELEDRMSKELIENMKRMCELKDFMWT